MTLFDHLPARRTDPISSRLAAIEVTASGLRAAQAGAALELVRAHSGCTSRELAELGELDRYALTRRLPELERSGLVDRGAMRVCRVGNRLAVTWRASA